MGGSAEDRGDREGSPEDSGRKVLVDVERHRKLINVTPRKEEDRNVVAQPDHKHERKKCKTTHDYKAQRTSHTGELDAD